jgi:hypothetical protein
MDKGLFSKGVSRRVVLLDNVVDLTNSSRDQSTRQLVLQDKGGTVRRTERERKPKCTNV